MSSGESYLSKADLNAALGEYEKAVKVCERSHNVSDHGNALMRIGEVRVRLGSYENALQAFTEAMSRFGEAGDNAAQENIRASLANLYGVMGDAAVRNGDLQSGLKKYQTAMGYTNSGTPVRGALHRNISAALVKLKEWQRALEHIKNALENYGSAGEPKIRASLYRTQGDVYLKLNRPSDADVSYENARSLYETLGDAPAAASVTRLAGMIRRHAGDSAGARKTFEKALALYGVSARPADIFQLHLDLAELCADVADFRGAAGHVEKCQALMPANTPVDNKLRLTVIRARVLSASGGGDKAIPLLEEAAAGFASTRNTVGEGFVYHALGDIHFRGASYKKAEEMYSRAFELFRSVGHESGQGAALRGKGEVSLFLGQMPQAVEYHTSALALFSLAKDVRGQASVHRALGGCSQREGDNAAARGHYDKALAMFEQAGDMEGAATVLRSQSELLAKLGESALASELIAKATSLSGGGNAQEYAHRLRGQGDIYLRTGENARALELYSESLEAYRKAGDVSGEGAAIRAVGDVHFQMGNFELAEQQYELALPLLVRAGDRSGQGSLFLARGEVQFMKGNSSRALEWYSRAQELFISDDDGRGRANVAKSQADLQAFLGKTVEAMQNYQSANKYYSTIGDMEYEAYTLFGIARVAAMEKKVDLALLDYEKGLELLEKVRRKTALSHLKKGFMEKVYEYYVEVVLFMLQNKYTEKAFRYAEAMKARSFIDQLAEARVVLKTDEPPETAAKRTALENRIAMLEQRMSDAARKSGEPGADYDSLVKQRSVVGRELEALDFALHLNNPLYASVHYPEPVTLAELQKRVIRSNEVLVEFVELEDTMYGFVVTAKELVSVKLPLSRKDLERSVADLLQELSYGTSKSLKNYEDMASRLHDSLVLPFEPYIGNRNIILVMDGILTQLPFEILGRRENMVFSYLVERGLITYVPSATVLALKRTTLRKEKFGKGFIGFGDPLYEEGTKESASLARLEASGKEISVVSEVFEFQRLPAKKLLRGEATRRNALLPEMKEYGYIHFAAHGILDNQFQAIALSRTPDSGDRGLLTIGDIMGSNYEKSRFVVLSACKTGLGGFSRGEGVTGLARAVMHAGSPAAVVSLWNIADSATNVLMENFYENAIVDGQPPNQALRSAKLDMIKEGTYRHPVFWGAFVMYGE